MQSLKEVIAALRVEVSNAIADSKPLPDHVHLEAERVVVTLGFGIEKNGQAVAFNFDALSATNSLSIEFRCGAAKQSLPETSAVIPQKTNKAELTGNEADLVIQQLAKVFGAPGFDSSARATVFCEAFENLSDADRRSLIESFSASTAPTSPASVKRSAGLIRRVCEAGPAGFNNAKKVLSQLFAEHTAAPLLELIARVWKTQQQWMD